MPESKSQRPSPAPLRLRFGASSAPNYEPSGISPKFTGYAWVTLVYNVLVILWGALVRATGSGAGCGAHWPLCNGEVVPVFPQWHTAIEFTHRATSGIALIAVVVLYIWARKTFSPRDAVRRAAFFALIFMINEALVGAVLVKFGLVAGNQSPMRALVLAFHLLNTMLLLGSLALAAWWSVKPAGARKSSPYSRLILVAVIAVLITTAAGGLAALGDTLFPAQSLAQGVQDDLSRSAPPLVRLRVLHPIIAGGTGIFLLWLALRCQARIRDVDVERWSRVIIWLTLAQFLLGGVNVLLLTPLWTQLSHLLLSDLLWISLVLFGASTIAAGTAR